MDAVDNRSRRDWKPVGVRRQHSTPGQCSSTTITRVPMRGQPCGTVPDRTTRYEMKPVEFLWRNVVESW
jgi:hypothetical protein